MKALLIPSSGQPKPVTLRTDDDGSALRDLQRYVNGHIEPFDVLFGPNVCLYVNEEGIGTCPPNRAIYTTMSMQEAGYLSQLDYTRAVREGELYTILFGDIIAVGFDPDSGMDRSLTQQEAKQVADYFTHTSKPGSGYAEAFAISRHHTYMSV